MRSAGLKGAARFAFSSFIPFFLGGAVAALLALAEGNYPLLGLKWALSLTVVAALLALLALDLVSAARCGEAGASFAFREFRLLFVASSLVMLGADFAASWGIMFYPFAFLLVLYAGTFASRWSLAGVMVYVTLLRWVEGGGPGSLQEAASAALFSVLVATFGAFGAVFLKVEVLRLRSSSKAALEQYFQGIVETARAFRFIAMPSAHLAGEEDEKKIRVLSVQSALEETRGTIYTMLETLRQGFGLHSCVVMWLAPGGETIRVIEASTASGSLFRGEVPSSMGLTGAAIRHARSLSICPVEPGANVICYYRTPEEVRSISILPIMEGKAVRGVLCADRLLEDPFTAEEERVFQLVADQIAGVVRTERTILYMARSRMEQGKLYGAASRLKDAVREEDVVQVLFDSTREIMGWDMAAFTSYDRASRSHCVSFADGSGAGDLVGLRFSENEGLVSQAARLGHPLPWRGDFDPMRQVVFTRKVRLHGLKSLCVIPVVAGEKALGTVVLGARREKAITPEKSRLLQVIVDQSAVAYQNALLMKELEQRATMDALTGLFNRRVFMEALERKLHSARRYKRQLSVIMADLDRFKAVNDTHGHQVGDEVLKTFAEVLVEGARQVDLVARLGGEEFVILCEETGREEALRLAERMRAGIEGREMLLDGGTALRVTGSFGVATFPHDAGTAEALIQRADECLYAAKKAGRNRVCPAADSMRKAV